MPFSPPNPNTPVPNNQSGSNNSPSAQTITTHSGISAITPQQIIAMYNSVFPAAEEFELPPINFIVYMERKGIKWYFAITQELKRLLKHDEERFLRCPTYFWTSNVMMSEVIPEVWADEIIGWSNRKDLKKMKVTRKNDNEATSV